MSAETEHEWRCLHCGESMPAPDARTLEAFRSIGKKGMPIHARCFDAYVSRLAPYAAPDEAVSLSELQRRAAN